MLLGSLKTSSDRVARMRCCSGRQWHLCPGLLPCSSLAEAHPLYFSLSLYIYMYEIICVCMSVCLCLSLSVSLCLCRSLSVSVCLCFCLYVSVCRYMHVHTLNMMPTPKDRDSKRARDVSLSLRPVVVQPEVTHLPQGS